LFYNKDRDEKELKLQIKNLKLDEYLPMNNSTEFKMPEVKAYSFRSKLYHEHMIENIVSTALNKIAYKQNNPDDKLKVDNKSVENEDELVDKMIKRTNCIIF
jgi:hypothetical protein